MQHQFIIASQSTRLLLDLVKRTRHAVKKENTKQYYRAKRLLMHDENGVTEQALPDVVGEEPEEDGDSVSTLSLWHRFTCEHLFIGSMWNMHHVTCSLLLADMYKACSFSIVYSI